MHAMERLPEHVKGLLITGTGFLILTPDTLLVRLIATDQWTMVFWRGVLMMIALGAFLAVYYRGEAWARVRAIGWAGVAVAASSGASPFLFIASLSHTSVANTLVIVSASPLIAAIFGRMFLAETVPARTWAAIVITMGGIGVLVSGSPGGGTINGDIAALATAACMAGAWTIVRRARTINMVPASALSGGLSALAVAPFATPFALSGGQAGLMLLLGLFLLPAAFGLMTLGPRYIPAPEVALILLLETVLGPLWVWLVIDEEPSAHALVGGAVVISALIGHSILALRDERRTAGAPPL